MVPWVKFLAPNLEDLSSNLKLLSKKPSSKIPICNLSAGEMRKEGPRSFALQSVQPAGEIWVQ